MKQAIFKQAISLAEGGRLIEAKNADYNTYERELMKCPYCSSPVFLKAKYSLVRSPHWAHFPGTGLHCVAKSQPSLITLEVNPKSELEFRQQCLAVWKTKLSKIFMYAYAQEGVGTLQERLGANWKQKIIKATDFCIAENIPDFPVNSWLKKVYPFMRNLTATTDLVDTFFEDIITNPVLSQQGDYLLRTRNNDWDTSFTQKIINTSFTPAEIIKHRDILVELLKYFTTPESIDVFNSWVYFQLVHLTYYFDSVLEIAFRDFSPEKVMVLHCIYNLCFIDWVTIFEKLRKGLEPEVYVISSGNLNQILPYLHLTKDLTPINAISRNKPKGFGKR